MAQPMRKQDSGWCANLRAAEEDEIKRFMSEINYSQLLRQIVIDYLEHRTSRVEYAAQRRDLLDRIDREFNGDDYWSGTSDVADSSTDGDSSPDITGSSPDITLVPKP